MTPELQKASLWKRISAFLFDAILWSIVTVLFAWLLSTALGFDRHYNTLEACYTRYGAEYQVDFDMSLSDYEAMDETYAGRLDEAYRALAADADAAYAYRMVLSLTILILSLSILLGFLVMEFTVPMVLGNGQTLGKKIFGVALMRTEGTRLTTVSLFIRTFLGKYAIETMVPVLLLLMLSLGTIGLMGTVALLGLLIAQVALLLATRNHSLIHDLLADTVCVDMASQRIFENKEALMAYKQQRHAEQVAHQTY